MGGGCISPSARIRTSDGESFFLKWNADHPALFRCEARGLKALARSGRLRVPEVIAVGNGEDRAPGWLLLEFVEAGRPGPGWGRSMAEGLATVHEAGSGDDSRDRSPAAPERSIGVPDRPGGTTHRPGGATRPAEATPGPRGQAEEASDPDHMRGAWGAWEDNFIGSLAQSNRSHRTWARFWIEERLRPQLERARSHGGAPGRTAEWEELFTRMEELVAPAEEEGPSLLHGDLWSGNAFADSSGDPVLVDPAVYHGHAEVDLAMMDLFGGFDASFWTRYHEIRPRAPGWEEVRRPLYQLYPLLVHVNLFGGGYAGRTVSTLREVLAAVG